MRRAVWFALAAAAVASCDRGGPTPDDPPARPPAATPAASHGDPAPAAFPNPAASPGSTDHAPTTPASHATIPAASPSAGPSSQDLESAPRYRHPRLLFSFEPPAGWRARVPRPPGIVRFEHPDGGVQFTLMMPPVPLPTAMSEFIDQWQRYLREYFRVDAFLSEQDTQVGPWSAHIVTIRAEDKFAYEVAIRRSVMEYYVFNGEAPPDQADRWGPVFEQVARSFRREDPAPTEPEVAGMARTRDLIRETAARGSLGFAVDQTFHLVAGGRRVGSYHVSARDEAVEGRPGVRFETRLEMELTTSNVTTAGSGTFTLDAAIQQHHVEQTLLVRETGEQKTFVFDGRLQGGSVHLSRRLFGGDEERDLDVPEGTILTGTGEILRRRLATSGQNRYASFVLYIAEDEPRIEQIEVMAPDQGDFEDPVARRRRNERFVAVISTRERGMTPDAADRVYHFFREDGSMIQESSGAQGYQLIEVRE